MSSCSSFFVNIHHMITFYDHLRKSELCVCHVPAWNSIYENHMRVDWNSMTTWHHWNVQFSKVLHESVKKFSPFSQECATTPWSWPHFHYPSDVSSTSHRRCQRKNWTRSHRQRCWNTDKHLYVVRQCQILSSYLCREWGRRQMIDPVGKQRTEECQKTKVF